MNTIRFTFPHFLDDDTEIYVTAEHTCSDADLWGPAPHPGCDIMTIISAPGMDLDRDTVAMLEDEAYEYLPTADDLELFV